MATPKHFHLSHLLRLVGSSGVHRKGSYIVRMFGTQGRSIGYGNKFNLHFIMPMAMFRLYTIGQRWMVVPSPK